MWRHKRLFVPLLCASIGSIIMSASLLLKENEEAFLDANRLTASDETKRRRVATGEIESVVIEPSRNQNQVESKQINHIDKKKLVSSDATIEPDICIPPIKSAARIRHQAPGIIKPKDFVYTEGCYTGMRKDRFGSSIIAMLKAHAYCHHFNMTLQGICVESDTNRMQKKKQERQELMSRVGLDVAIPWSCPSTSRKELVPQKWYGRMGHFLWTGEWLKNFRSQINYPDRDDVFLPLLSSGNNNSSTAIKTVSGRLQVVIYVRRNDVSPCIGYSPMNDPPYTTSRYLPNSYYFRLVEEYVPKSREMDIHVFSMGRYYEPIEEFKREPYILHEDSDVDVVWRAVMMADVVILSKSGFSQVPALLNKHGKVIYTPYYDPPVEGWTTVKPELVAELDYNVSLMAREEDCFKVASKGKNRTVEGPNCTFYSVVHEGQDVVE